MRTKIAILAAATLLILGTGSIVAAVDEPRNDTVSEDELPANFSVDVTNSEKVSDEGVDQAIKTAWANDTIQSYFDKNEPVSFEIWASGLDGEAIRVKAAPIKGADETRVTATVDLSEQQVTSITEPMKLNSSRADTISTSDYNLNATQSVDDTSDKENATRLTSDQADQVDLNQSSIERSDDGTLTFEVDDD